MIPDGKPWMNFILSIWLNNQEYKRSIVYDYRQEGTYEVTRAINL